MKKKGRDLMGIFGRGGFPGFALVFFCFLAAFLPAGAAMAQPPSAQMEGVMQQIQALKMWKLTKALDLDEQTASRLFPLMNSFDKQRAEVAYNQRLLMNSLRDALNAGSEAQMESAIRKLIAGRAALERINDQEMGGLGKILTVTQQAKFMLFMPRFNRQMKMMIRRARRARMGAGGAGRQR